MNPKTIGFGIAGNFARHLEQAGESEDFIEIVTEDEDAPKGIFPTYIPCSDTFLGIYPFSTDTINKPENPIQMEPEVALVCEVHYDEGKVKQLIPKYFAAYNDCSIRIQGAPKISHKKNWGINSKGIAANLLKIDNFSKGSVMDNYTLTSFIKREAILHQYGENSPLLGYSYFYEKLNDWIVDKLNHQKDQGPLEDLPTLLKTANYPKELLISIGATRYTLYGETHYLQSGDKLFVIVYDHTYYSHEDIVQMIKKESFTDPAVSVLVQQVH